MAQGGFSKDDLDLSKVSELGDKISSAADKIVNAAEKISKTKIRIDVDKSAVKDIHEVEQAISALETKVTAPQQKMKYFQSIENATVDLKKKWNDLANAINKGDVSSEKMFSNSYSTAVLRYANAFEALGGDISSVNPEISEFVNKMREMEQYTQKKGYNFTVEGFKSAFAEFDKLKEQGVSFAGFETSKKDVAQLLSLSTQATSAATAAATATTSAHQKVAEAINMETRAEQESASTTATAESQKQEAIRRTVAEMERELNASRVKNNNNIDESSLLWDLNIDDELSDIEKYSRALEELKWKRQEALENATMWQNSLADSQNKGIAPNSNYEKWMNEEISAYYKYADQIEYVQERLQTALKNYVPNAEGSNAEAINSLVLLLQNLNEQIDKIAIAFGTIDDNSGVPNLLSSLQGLKEEINSVVQEIQNLSKAFSGINMNVTIGGAGGDPIGRMSEYGDSARSTVKVLKEAFAELQSITGFSLNNNSSIKYLTKDAKDLYAELSRIGELETTAMTGKFNGKNNLKQQNLALKELIDLYQKAASYANIDISGWTTKYSNNIDKSLESTQKMLSGEKQVEDTVQKISNSFGNVNNVNLDGVSAQLDAIIQKLEQIGTLFKDNFTTVPQSTTILQSDQLTSFLTVLQEIKAAILEINNMVIKPKTESANYISTDVGTTGMSYEIEQADKLQQKIVEVTNSVNTKTKAFQDEEQIAVGTVQREVSELEVLNGQLLEIISTIEKIKATPIDLDFKFLDNENINGSLGSVLSELNDKIKGLDIESLTKLSEGLKGLNVNNKSAENLEYVAIALEEFRNSLSGISAEENNFLSSINAIVSKTNELKDLCKILESSTKKIKEAGNAVGSISGGDTTKKDVSMSAEEELKKRSQAISESVEKLKGSTNGIIASLTEFKDSNDNLVKAQIKQKEILDNAVKTTTTTVNYNKKDGSAYSSDIDIYDYEAIRKQSIQEANKSYQEEIKLLQEKNKLEIENLNTSNKNYESNKNRLVQLEQELATLRQIRQTNGLTNSEGDKLVKDTQNALAKEYSTRKSQYNANIQNDEINSLLKEQKSEYEAIYQAKLKIANLDTSKADYNITKQELENEISEHQQAYLLIQKKLGSYGEIEQRQTHINELLQIGSKYQSEIYDARKSNLNSNLEAQIKSENKIAELEQKINTSNNTSAIAGYNSDLEAEKAKLNVLQQEAAQYDDILSKAERESYIAEKTKEAREKSNAVTAAALESQLEKESEQTSKANKKTYAAFEQEQIQAASEAQKELNALIDQYISKRNETERASNPVDKAVFDSDSITLLDQIEQKINSVRDTGLLTENQIEEALKRIDVSEDELTKKLEVRKQAQNELNTSIAAQYNRQNYDQIKSQLTGVKLGNATFDSIKTDSSGKATITFIEEVGDVAKIATVKVDSLNEAVSRIKNGNFDTTGIKTAFSDKSIKSDESSLKEEENKIMSVKEAYKVLIDTKEEYLALDAKRTNNTATDDEIAKLEELTAKRKEATEVLNTDAINKTAEAMNKLKFSGTGENFETAFGQASQKIEEFNNKLKSGEISLVEYREKVNQIQKDLKGIKGDTKFVDYIDADSIEQAKNKMNEYAQAISQGAAIQKTMSASGNSITYYWKDQENAVHNLKMSYNELTGAMTEVHKITSVDSIGNAINKTAEAMNKLKYTGVGETFENVFAQASQKIEQLNSELQAGQIDLEKYEKSVAAIQAAVKDNKTIKFIDTDNLEKAKNLMTEIANRQSGGKAEISWADNGRQLTATWVDQNNMVQKLVMSYDELSGALTQTASATQATQAKTKTFVDLLRQGWQNVRQYVMTFMGFYAIIRQIRNGITIIKELDTALTEMRKVSDESVSSLKDFQVESFDIAKSVGTTAQQIQESTADWMGEILVPLYGNI